MEALAETFLIAGGIGLSLVIAGLILVQTFRTMAPSDKNEPAGDAARLPAAGIDRAPALDISSPPAGTSISLTPRM